MRDPLVRWIRVSARSAQLLGAFSLGCWLGPRLGYLGKDRLRLAVVLAGLSILLDFLGDVVARRRERLRFAADSAHADRQRSWKQAAKARQGAAS